MAQSQPQPNIGNHSLMTSAEGVCVCLGGGFLEPVDPKLILRRGEKGGKEGLSKKLMSALKEMGCASFIIIIKTKQKFKLRNYTISTNDTFK